MFDLESGKEVNTTIATLQKLADVLECKVSDLFCLLCLVKYTFTGEQMENVLVGKIRQAQSAFKIFGLRSSQIDGNKKSACESGGVHFGEIGAIYSLRTSVRKFKFRLGGFEQSE